MTTRDGGGGSAWGFAKLALLAAGLLGAGCADNAPPWSESSQRIEVTCGSFFEGSAMFRAKRSELTAEQLTALENLELAGSSGECAEDTTGCSVTITDDAGIAKKYRANEGDGRCGQSEPLLGFATLQPFIASMHCQSGKQEGRSALSANAQCLNGMFSPSNGTTVHQLLHIDEVGRSYHVELDHCVESQRLGQISMQVSVNGQVIEGSTPAVTAADEACLALDFTSSVAGDVELSVTTTPSFLPAGDYFLQFR